MTNEQLVAHIARMQRALRNEVNEDTRRDWARQIISARRIIASRVREASAPQPTTNRERRQARREVARQRTAGNGLVNGGRHIERQQTVRSTLGFAADRDR